LRVSQSISKNMLKDMNKDAYGHDDPNAAVTDINLENRDQEIHFGEENDKDGDPVMNMGGKN